MATRKTRSIRAPRIPIPTFTQKIDLLIKHRGVESWEALAAILGKGESTVRGWGTDARDGGIDSVPEESFPKLRVLFEKILPRHSVSEIDALLGGDIAVVDLALTMESSRIVEEFFAGLKIEGNGFIYTRDDDALLVQRAHINQPADYQLKLGQHFRIEWPRDRRFRFSFGLQRAPTAWGAIPTEEASNVIRSPGILEKNSAYLEENESIGNHVFYCFQTIAPFPALLYEYGDLGLPLDMQGALLLNGFFSGQPDHSRACYRVSAIFSK